MIRNCSLMVATCLTIGCGYVPEGDLKGTDYKDDPIRFAGEKCNDVDEPWRVCVDGFVCSKVTGTCLEAGKPESGTVPEEGPCTSNNACGFGMVCDANGTCQPEGEEGTAGNGEPCEESTDCQAFLACLEGLCFGTQPSTIFLGATCDSSQGEDGPLKAYFEVDDDPEEFYRLPFPNDIRVKDGKIDLTGHARPDPLSEEFGDPLGNFFDMVENDLDGFGTQSAVFFRLSRYPNDNTLKLGENIIFVNIDPDSESYGETLGAGYRISSSQGMYICGNWLVVTPSTGYPLEPNTTYAVILTDGIKERGNNPDGLARDADFSAVIASSRPSDAALVDAWEAYQPLRDYLSDADALALVNDKIESSDSYLSRNGVMSAAVFTTGDPTAKVRNIRDGVRSEDPPEVKGLETDDSDEYLVLHTGTVSVPFYQDGDRPFAKEEEGGAISYTRNGLPVLVETEDVKFALTVPVGEAPDTGWPLIIYAHGTGGSEMSFVDNGVAERMAAIGAAVLGMEQVQHGDRRNLSGEDADSLEYSPQLMFYNFLNPRAARDNNLQAAAELFQAVRLVEDFAAISREDITFDLERVYFFGHSQGTQGSFIGAVFEPGIKGMILSGAGGFLIESLLGKQEPVDLKTTVSLALMDIDVSRTHPALNIVQAAMDSVDPVNFGRYVFAVDLTEDGIPARSVFMSSGEGDTYTPDTTQTALARSIGLHQVVTSGEALDVFESEQPLPIQRTHGAGGGVTAVVVRYAPTGGSNGHRVMFQNDDAISQADTFIASMIDPDISPPILSAP